MNAYRSVMMAVALDPVEEFGNYFPDPFLKDWVKVIIECYQEAATTLPGLGVRSQHARWGEPYTRRALIESRTQDVAAKYPKISVFERKTRTDSCPYVVLTSGPIVLTESMVEDRRHLPREAEYRRANALFNRHLFSEFEPTPTDKRIYAILAHVPAFGRSYPQYVDVIFPNADYSGVLGYGIDLMGRFSADLTTQTVSEERVADPEPKLKTNRKRMAE